ncbi:hypothetical protein [Sphingomonas sp. CFBP 8764]|nr:hypothetical protein [Sphingomonas sp. CFBP 8764]
MDNTDKLFVIFVTLYAVWQLIRIARGLESISAVRAIAEQNRR